MKLLVFAVLCQIALSNAKEYISNKSCPDRPVMQNFDIKQIAGRWYNLMQYEDIYAQSFKCGHGNYSVIDDNSLRVHECELDDRKYSCITGVIALMDPKRNPLEGSTSYAYINDPTKVVDEFKYLSVDYNDHAVVYNCKNIEEGRSIHHLWIASRTPKASPNGKIAIDAIIDKYFDRSAIKIIDQSAQLCDPRM